MNIKSSYLKVLIGVITLVNLSCERNFLDKKPSTNIVQPHTLNDLQSLLENGEVINRSIALPILAADEYEYTSYETWQSTRTSTEKNSYIWAADLFQGEDGVDWNIAYSSIFYANNVLDGLENIAITSTNRTHWNNIKGWALFARAWAYYDLVRNFSAPYDKVTADTASGVPIRLHPSVDEIVSRSTIRETYDRILADLSNATLLLNTESPVSKRNRPSKCAAFALAARIHLSMRQYDMAELYADSVLEVYDELIDYNTVSMTSTTPFSKTNAETLFPACTHNDYPALAAMVNPYIKIDLDLIRLYANEDLRRSIYFSWDKGVYVPKRNYMGGGLYPFTGLATDEIYLIKAECLARRSDISTSMKYLNQLLIKRYKKGAFSPLKASSADDALNKVLLERRKELVWRGLRWDDLKRLNKEGADITLTRELNTKVYILQPGDSRYTFPIPDKEIALSGIEQNPR